MSDSKPDLSAISTPRKIIAGSAVFLLIVSFLPWYSFDLGPMGSFSEGGWHQLGTLAWLFTIVLIAVAATRIFGVLPLDEAKSDLVELGVSALVLLFGIIFVIQRLSDGSLGFAFFLGVVGLIALGAGAFLLFTSSDAKATLKTMQDNAGDKGDTPPPPATPPTV